MQERMPRVNTPPRPPTQKSPPDTGRSSAPAASDSPPAWPGDPQVFLEAMNELSLHGVGIAETTTGSFASTNKVCQNIYGLKSEEIVGRHFHEFYANPQDPERDAGAGSDSWKGG